MGQLQLQLTKELPDGAPVEQREASDVRRSLENHTLIQVSNYQRLIEKHKQESSSGKAELVKMKAQYKLLAIDLLADADSSSSSDTARLPLLSASSRRMVCLSAYTRAILR